MRIYFRLNDSAYDPDYRNNRENLREIISRINSCMADSAICIESVTLRGNTSPEGDVQINRRLSVRRRAILESLLRSQITISDSILCRGDENIPWDYLATILAESEIMNRDKAIAIILEETDSGKTNEARIKRLMQLDEGAAWQSMKAEIFPEIRNASIILVTSQREMRPMAVKLAECIDKGSWQIFEPTAEYLTQSDSIAAQVKPLQEHFVSFPWNRRLHVKTNVIGWTLGIANIAGEFDLAPHWSFTLPLYYSAWNYFTCNVKFRTLTFQPEFRYWIIDNNERLFAGIHFGYGQYNYALHGKYRYQDHDGISPALGGGLSVGYRMPLCLNGRLKMEFSIGVGVYRAYYDKFLNHKNGSLVSTVNRVFVGVDQANVSLVYTFDLFKKGGAR